jgi:amino-acid N-acetyltransferase
MLTYSIINKDEDFKLFKKLVADAGLPTEDLDYQQQVLIAFYEDQELIATAGLEIYGTDALLRSVAVVPEKRNAGIGSQILDLLYPLFTERNIRNIYLLTETAKDFFLKKGFELIERKDVPQSIQTSAEFRSVCPTSAFVMVKKILI